MTFGRGRPLSTTKLLQGYTGSKSEVPKSNWKLIWLLLLKTVKCTSVNVLATKGGGNGKIL